MSTNSLSRCIYFMTLQPVQFLPVGMDTLSARYLFRKFPEMNLFFYQKIMFYTTFQRETETKRNHSRLDGSFAFALNSFREKTASYFWRTVQ